MSSASNVNEDNFITMVPYKCKCMQIVYLDKRFQASISSCPSPLLLFPGKRYCCYSSPISPDFIISHSHKNDKKMDFFFSRQESSVPGVISCIELEIVTPSDSS